MAVLCRHSRSAVVPLTPEGHHSSHTLNTCRINSDVTTAINFNAEPANKFITTRSVQQCAGYNTNCTSTPPYAFVICCFDTRVAPSFYIRVQYKTSPSSLNKQWNKRKHPSVLDVWGRHMFSVLAMQFSSLPCVLHASAS
jgi:hypothetical protein